MPNQTTRYHFEKQLTRLGDDLLLLGSMARVAVRRAMEALRQRDIELARTVIAEDVGINRLRFDVESQCYALLATEQPVAGDLRRIAATLTMANDLERIGDHAKRIASIFLRMQEDPQPIVLADLPHMSEMALVMLDRALQLLTKPDVAEAEAICRADDEVDALHRQNFNLVLSYMLENQRFIHAGTALIQVAHELERVADRATNIAERVIYSATGELVDLNV